MLLVASGIATVLKIDNSRGIALGTLSAQKSVFLLRIYVVYIGFLGLEVESYRVGFILVLSHGEHRLVLHPILDRRIAGSCGVDKTAVKTHIDLVTGQVHVLIFHIRRPEKVCRLRAGIINQRVIGRIFYGSFDAPRPLAVERIEPDRIVHHLVVTVDGPLKGIHLRRVYNHISKRVAPLHTVDRRGIGLCRLLFAFEKGGMRACHHQYDDRHQQHYDSLSSHLVYKGK